MGKFKPRATRLFVICVMFRQEWVMVLWDVWIRLAQSRGSAQTAGYDGIWYIGIGSLLPWPSIEWVFPAPVDPKAKMHALVPSMTASTISAAQALYTSCWVASWASWAPFALRLITHFSRTLFWTLFWLSFLTLFWTLDSMFRLWGLTSTWAADRSKNSVIDKLLWVWAVHRFQRHGINHLHGLHVPNPAIMWLWRTDSDSHFQGARHVGRKKQPLFQCPLAELRLQDIDMTSVAIRNCWRSILLDKTLHLLLRTLHINAPPKGLPKS